MALLCLFPLHQGIPFLRPHRLALQKWQAKLGELQTEPENVNMFCSQPQSHPKSIPA